MDNNKEPLIRVITQEAWTLSSVQRRKTRSKPGRLRAQLRRQDQRDSQHAPQGRRRQPGVPARQDWAACGARVAEVSTMLRAQARATSSGRISRAGNIDVSSALPGQADHETAGITGRGSTS